MKKNDQTKNDILKIKKEPKNIKELLPSNIQNIRKNCPIKIPQNPENLPQRNFNNLLEPIKLFPEWPKEEELKVKIYKNSNKFLKILKDILKDIL
jgi:hypothetical protein